MAYINDVINSIKCKCEDIAGANIKFYIGRGAVIEGFSKLITCSDTSIIIRFSKNDIKVEGNNMKIVSVNCKELTIIGNILSISEIK